MVCVQSMDCCGSKIMARTHPLYRSGRDEIDFFPDESGSPSSGLAASDMLDRIRLETLILIASYVPCLVYTRYVDTNALLNKTLSYPVHMIYAHRTCSMPCITASHLFQSFF